MHSKRTYHTLRGIWAISLLGACCLSQPVAAEPVLFEEPAPAIDNASPVDLTWDSAALAIDHTPEATPQEHSTPDESAASRTNLPRFAPAQVRTPPFIAHTGPDLDAEIRSTFKKNVRPLHDQVMDSGAIEAWNNFKTEMGIGTTRAADEGATSARPETYSRWEIANLAPGQAPDNRQRTTTQTEVDRALADHMLKQLIGEITPWALSALGLYLLGYLIKLGFDLVRQRSIRRRERRAARARRRSAHKASRARSEA